MIDEEILFQPSGKKIKISEIKSNKFSIILFFLIFFCSFSYFLYLQFFLKQLLLSFSEKIKNLTYFSFPPRGNIYDRNNRLLVTSESSFDVYLDLNKISVTDSHGFTRGLTQIFEENIPGRYFYRGNQLIIRDVPKEVALRLMLKNEEGIKVIPSFKRKYLISEDFGNLIGYVGFPEEESKYHQEEFIGKAGIELTYQDYLRGKLGEIVYEKTSSGLKKIKETEPLPGKNLVLTIDAEFQKKAYELIDKYFKEHNYKKGAFIALNPNTGEILSLISYPSYDPNWFFDSQKVNQILNSPYQPLFNRAVSGLYLPGSTIKLIVAAAALEEKVVTPETRIYSAGEIRIPNPYFPGTYSIFKDNKVHGWTDVRKAIADSVNVYFYVVGGGYPYPNEEIPIKDALGIYRLKKWWEKFNLGQKSGIDLIGEKTGFLPSPETKAKNLFDSVWRLGDTYNVSIGQGDILVTPLQIALWTASMSTNKIYQPFIVKKILDQNGRVIFERHPKLLKENLINPENLKVIQEGMRITVTQGTAKILGDLPIAGKSGTPEIFGKKKLNAIFTGYMPYNQHKIVMTLLIEEVPIGSVATLPLYHNLASLALERFINHGRNSF